MKCGAELAPEYRFCEKCGQPVAAAPAPQATQPAPAGNLLKTVPAARVKGISTAQGKLIIYANRIEFHPSTIGKGMNIMMLSFKMLDKQDMPMSEIARAERCTYMGMNVGVKLTLKTGKSFIYSVGLRGVTGIDPQEIVDLINAQLECAAPETERAAIPCPSCGSAVPPEYIYCEKCGTKVR